MILRVAVRQGLCSTVLEYRSAHSKIKYGVHGRNHNSQKLNHDENHNGDYDYKHTYNDYLLNLQKYRLTMNQVSSLVLKDFACFFVPK